MAYEPKPGQGSAWPNEKKIEDWHADFTGKIVLPDGKTHWLEVYPKNSDGKTWYQVKIRKEVVSKGDSYSAAHKPFPAQDNHNKAKANGFQELDNDIPF